MPIKFSCPHCKRVMTVKDQMAGKKGTCTGCKQVVTVPRPAVAPPAPNAADAVQKQPVRAEGRRAAAECSAADAGRCRGGSGRPVFR